MNPLETEAAGAVLINGAEADLANASVKMAELNALGTPAFEANYNAAAVAKANARFQPAVAAIARAKLRVAAYHAALSAAQATATFPRPRGGGK